MIGERQPGWVEWSMPRLFTCPDLSGEEKVVKKRPRKGVEGSRKGGRREDPETWAVNCAGRG